MKQRIETVVLQKIVGDGQALGTLEDGQKVFVWGALPGETAEVLITKRKSRLSQGIAEKVLKPAPERVEPKDPESYLSTSPWQIMSPAAEAHWKQQLVQDAFAMHDIKLQTSEFVTDETMYGYRNKVEFSWWWDNETETLDLAFFRRGTHGKIPVEGTSLARPDINEAARRVRDLLREKNVEARSLKTLLLRCSQKGEINAQLYVKEQIFEVLNENDIVGLNLHGFEIIYSKPESPASVVTEVLATYGQSFLTDTILGIEFQYSTGGFFQVNVPVYEKALEHIREWVGDRPVVDMYSGVGTIGLTIGGEQVTMVEQNETCVQEMKRNVDRLNSAACVVSAAAEDSLDYITPDHTIILDPPRAGLHEDVVFKLKDERPQRIIYLSCNPVTQARDIAKLLDRYHVVYSATFNFFPRTPHIEQLIVLDLA